MKYYYFLIFFSIGTMSDTMVGSDQLARGRDATDKSRAVSKWSHGGMKPLRPNIDFTYAKDTHEKFPYGFDPNNFDSKSRLFELSKSFSVSDDEHRADYFRSITSQAEMLLERNPELIDEIQDGETLFRNAIMTHNIPLFHMLLKRGADIHKKAVLTDLPTIHLAVRYGNLDAIKKMLQIDLKIANTLDYNQKTSLQYVQTEPYELKEVLSKKDLQALPQTKDQIAQLLSAVIDPTLLTKKEALERLFKLSTSIPNSETKNREEYFRAIASQAKVLLEKNPELINEVQDGETLFRNAIMTHNTPLFDMLLKKGVTINKKSRDINIDILPINLAAHYCNLDAIKKMLQIDPKMANVLDRNQKSALDYLIESNDELLSSILSDDEFSKLSETKEQIAELLLKSIDLNLLNKRDDDGRTILHRAILIWNPSVIKVLVKFRYQEFPDYYGRTISNEIDRRLDKAIKENDTPMIDQIYNVYLNNLSNFITRDELKRLMAGNIVGLNLDLLLANAITQKMPNSISKMLLEHGANPNINNGFNHLIFRAFKDNQITGQADDNIELAELLMKYGAELNEGRYAIPPDYKDGSRSKYASYRALCFTNDWKERQRATRA